MEYSTQEVIKTFGMWILMWSPVILLAVILIWKGEKS